MVRLVVRLLINAVALWLTTLLLAPNVMVEPYPPGGASESVLTFLLVAFIFGLVNGVIGTAVRVIAFPLYLLTLGLLALVVNGLLLLLVAWLTNLLGFGLYIEGFGWGVLGALLLGVISWLLGILLRPWTRREQRP
ncbi:MAG: phage holin family protein [Micrococcales bacterium]|nr:phage holin family protein [Micrococcales bacterium]